ncbi:hypothetical protein ACFFRR_000770 [Megaselia abdita]
MLASALLVLLVQFQPIQGHGMVMDPVNRASRWRFNSSAPQDWTDNEGYCGGISIHHNTNGGKCGLCGDNYADPKPRAHELGGVFGEGVIVASYNAGNTVPIEVKLSANHMGSFHFHLCNIDANQIESEDCFDTYPIEFENGSTTYPVSQGLNLFKINVRLPAGVQCDHCVLRWTYVTGNGWGICEDGKGALGCGPQETFKGCSDIAIY